MSTRKNLSQKATQKNTTEPKTSLKNFQLRAFTITQQNQPVTKLQQSIVQLMQKRLQSEKISADSRTMLLNQDDPDKISDSFPYYEIRDNTILGTIMRISNSEKVQHVPVDLMKKEKFSVSETINVYTMLDSSSPSPTRYLLLKTPEKTTSILGIELLSNEVLCRLKKQKEFGNLYFWHLFISYLKTTNEYEVLKSCGL